MKQINGNYLVIALIAFFAFIIYWAARPSETKKETNFTCTENKSYLFDVENYRLLNKDRLALTINVPNNVSLTYDELLAEVQCYLQKVNNERKPSALQATIYKADANKYKTFKGEKFIGQVTYAPNGKWGDFNSDDPLKFDMTSFSKESFKPSE